MEDAKGNTKIYTLIARSEMGNGLIFTKEIKTSKLLKRTCLWKCSIHSKNKTKLQIKGDEIASLPLVSSQS